VPAPNVDLDRATVVAFYGRKPPRLVELIEAVQGSAEKAFGGRFSRRPVPDVHATVVGLEDRTPGCSSQDLDGLVRYLVGELRSARLEMRFGGYADNDRQMLSRGRSLYERTIGVQGGQLVLLGWPVDIVDGSRTTPTMRLAYIRRACERFGFPHKYHRNCAPLDPDAYMVLGELTEAPTAEIDLFLFSARERLRSWITQTTLTEADLALVEYVDLALPRATSSWWTFDTLNS
jgi:hypothetical protein